MDGDDGRAWPVSGAVASDDVIDIFTAAGVKRPDFSILM